MKTLCLGEAHVDLRGAPAVGFVARVGGAAAQAALGAARLGADVALGVSPADDLWGRWLRGELEAAGVDLAHAVAADGPTPVRFVAGAETQRYGAEPPAPDARGAVEAADALLLTAVDADAHEHALRLGRPVVLAADGDTAWRGLLDGAFLVVCDAAAAEALSGERDLERAARGLLAGGVRHVLLAGGDRVLLRGAEGLRARGAAAPAAALAARAVAALGTSGFYAPALAAAVAVPAR